MIKRTEDPRSPLEEQQDELVQQAIGDGSLSRLTPEERQQSLDRARLKKEARRKVEELGLDLARLRRHAGMTQAQLARIIGTQRTAISRLESGRYGGLTVDRLLAILAAIQGASGLDWGQILSLLSRGRVYRFGAVQETILSTEGR